MNDEGNPMVHSSYEEYKHCLSLTSLEFGNVLLHLLNLVNIMPEEAEGKEERVHEHILVPH